jgi:hypothetical protein
MALVVAAAGSPLAIAAAAVPGLVGLGVGTIHKRNQRRAEELFERMISADEDPAEFAAHVEEKLTADDPETVTAFRDLLTASVQRLAESAIGPIALIGRQYVRKDCPPWIARGWLRVLSELSDDEIAGVEELARQGILATNRLNRMDLVKGPRDIELRRSRGPRGEALSTSSLVPYEPAFAAGYADRLVEMMQSNHLGYSTKGQPSAFSMDGPDLFIVRAEAFRVLVRALPAATSAAEATEAANAIADADAAAKAAEEEAREIAEEAAALAASNAYVAAQVAAAKAAKAVPPDVSAAVDPDRED